MYVQVCVCVNKGICVCIHTERRLPEKGIQNRDTCIAYITIVKGKGAGMVKVLGLRLCFLTSPPFRLRREQPKLSKERRVNDTATLLRPGNEKDSEIVDCLLKTLHTFA